MQRNSGDRVTTNLRCIRISRDGVGILRARIILCGKRRGLRGGRVGGHGGRDWGG